MACVTCAARAHAPPSGSLRYNGLEITPQITLLLTFFGKKSYPPFIFVTKGTEAPPRHAEIASDR